MRVAPPDSYLVGDGLSRVRRREATRAPTAGISKAQRLELGLPGALPTAHAMGSSLPEEEDELELEPDVELVQ